MFALLFTVMPMNMSWILIILGVTTQFSANMEIAVAVFLFLLFIYLFYARMATRESLLILFTVMAFHFNVPYLIPILVGLYFSVSAIIPVTIGVFVNAQIPMVMGFVGSAPASGMADMELTDLITELPTAFTAIYETLIGSLAGTEWLFTALVFAMVIILVHFVSRQAIDYAKEIAIVLGSVMTIFGFIIAVLVTDGNVNIGMMILLTLLSMVLALFVRFFDGVLDYQRAESVQFEDDNNYYHVKIVPKVIMTKPQRVVKRIRPESAKPSDNAED